VVLLSPPLPTVVGLVLKTHHVVVGGDGQSPHLQRLVGTQLR
jgi:hypothetical protein